jgi:hypothetical protein
MIYASIVVIGVAVVALVVLVFMNGGSEKIVSTALPAAAATIVAALLAVIFSLKTDVFEEDIPVMFIVDRDTLQLGLLVERVEGPRRVPLFFLGSNVFAGTAAQDMLKAFPDLKQQEVTKYHDLYGDVLIRVMVERLFTYFAKNWDHYTRSFPYLYGRSIAFGPHPEFPAGPSLEADQIPWGDAKKWFPENKAFSVGIQHPVKFGVPKGTRISGSKGSAGEHILTLKNQLSEVRIEVLQDIFMNRLSLPEYILDIPEPQRNQFMELSYFIRIAARFDYLRSGHTDMEKHRRWVRNIASVLRDEFDFTAQWNRAKDAYVIAAANRTMSQPAYSFNKSVQNRPKESDGGRKDRQLDKKQGRLEP